MKKIFLSIISLGLLSQMSIAQNPAPPRSQAKAIVLQGGTAHLGNGQVITNAMIRFENGQITYVGQVQDAVSMANAEVFNTTGKHIYPGLIAPSTLVGLTEIEAVRATNDHTEVGNINPNVRAVVAYNTDADMIPTLRGNGVLMVQSMPQGGLVTGQSAVMETDGWNWEDAAVKADDGVYVNWPSFISGQFDFETFRVTLKKNEKRNEGLQELHRLFDDALTYRSAHTATNPKLEAMQGLFDGSKVMYVMANYGKEIVEAIQFAKSKGVKKITIVGAEESLMVADYLKEQGVPVIVSETHRLPNKADDAYDMPYKLPGLLHKAGVQVSIGYLGMHWRARNLPFVAGTAVTYGGINKEEALQMITLNTAKALGIDNVVGSIEKGKHATLVVSSGDLLDMRTANVELIFMRGKKSDLDDKQKRLYKKYQEKYGK